MLKHKIVIHSADAGRKTVLLTVDEKPFCSLDANDNRVRIEYDTLRRPVRTWVEPGGANKILTDVVIYGEEIDALLNVEDISKQGNHRGQPFAALDGAGMVLNLAYDFKGNLLVTSRRLTKDYGQAAEGATPSDRKVIVPDWQSIAFDQSLTELQEKLQEPLESETFISISRFDALNRAYRSLAPDHDHPVNMPAIPDKNWLHQLFAWLKDKSGASSPPINANGSIYDYTFNDAGLLETVHLDIRGERGANPPGQSPRCFVKNIDYNAKGQRQRIEYGNGVITEYKYCSETFRLSRLFSYKTSPDHPVQDLIYTYDPVGNISQIEDGVFPIVFHSNEKVCPTSRYRYDPTYRLIEASGREHKAIRQNILTSNGKLKDIFINTETQSINNGQALRNYIEKYRYDRSGNIEEIRHIARNNSWTRTQTYATSPNLADHPNVPVSNRLLTSGTNQQTGSEVEHSHDSNGNMILMPNLPELTWDHADQLKRAKLDNTGNNWVWYTYDAAGMRVRKVVQKSVTTDVERIYVGGFEIWQDMKNVLINSTTLHVMDGKQRIALVETENLDESIDLRIRYQLTNHLGSSMMQLDEYGNNISCEEYFPYGGTAYLAGKNWSEVERKWYRYSGKERDDETGLYYYGARYYAPWMGRWCSCDKTGSSNESNSYQFVRGGPTNYFDPNGLESEVGVNEHAGPEIRFFIGYTEGMKENAIDLIKEVGNFGVDIFTGLMVQAVGDDLTKDEWASGKGYRSSLSRIWAMRSVDPIMTGIAQLPQSWDNAFLESFEAGSRGDWESSGRAFSRPAFDIILLTDAIACLGKSAVSASRWLYARSSYGQMALALSEEAAIPAKMVYPLNGRVNIGGGFETPGRWTNLQPYLPGGPERGVPNAIRALAEEMGEVLVPGSVTEMISSRLPSTIDLQAWAKGAYKAMQPGATFKLNFYEPSFHTRVAEVFAEQGFKNVQVINEGAALFVTGMR
jgi:RHS repeat-associated protein